VFAALPFAVILLPVITFVVFFWVVLLAEIFDCPPIWGLGMSVLGPLLLLAVP
jgi:hypothetical protein